MNKKIKLMKKIDSGLCSQMLDSSKALSNSNNPFIKNISTLSAKELERFLGQYCHFPRHIISILVSACYTMGYHEWEDVVAEIRENIFSELGGDYDKIDYHIPPHYSMLRKSIVKGLGIDVSTIEIKKATNNFLKPLSNYMSLSVENSAGAVYALEATAINELQIVYDLTKHLFKLKKKVMPESLKKFFEVHIDDIEIGHRNNLFDAIEKEIKNDKAAQDFYDGVQFTIDLMDKWWAALYKEIKSNMKDD